MRYVLMIALMLPIIACFADDFPVPAPVPLKTDINVGVYVFPGWYRHEGASEYDYRCHDDDSEWRNAVARMAKPRPLLGFYDDSLPEVNDWHIKWALEAGISWFAFDWYWNAGEKRLASTLEKGFLNARYSGMMKFCIHWCNHGLDWKKPLDFSPDALEEMIRYCADNYFTRPNYLKINGRPVFMIYEIKPVIRACGGPEKFQSDVLPRLNAVCRERGLGELYLIRVSNDPRAVSDVPVGDAFTAYSYHWVLTDTPFSSPGSAPYSEIVEGVKPIWSQMLDKKNHFMISAQAGWDDSPRTIPQGRPNWVRTGTTMELFERMLTNGRALVQADFPYFLIEAWNEWGEGSHLEPSKEFGFGYLDAILRVFGRNVKQHKWAVPTPAQIRSYSVLDDEELAAAHERESGPPAPITIPNRSLTFSVDPKALPDGQVWQWPTSLAETPPAIANLTTPEIVDRKVQLKVLAEDPFLILAGDWPPIAEVSGIVFRARLSGTDGMDRGDFFWETDKSAIGRDVRRFQWVCDGEFHTYLLTFTQHARKEEVLKRIRVDFPDITGAEIEIEWVRVYTGA